MLQIKPLHKEAFVIENQDGTMDLVFSDPRIEDWEHIYYDVYVGSFRLTDLSGSGYFVCEDSGCKRWLPVKDGKPIKRWFTTADKASAFLTKLSSKWSECQEAMETHCNTEESFHLYYEDLPKFESLISSFEKCLIGMYKNHPFVWTTDAEGIPDKVFALVKKGDECSLEKLI